MATIAVKTYLPTRGGGGRRPFSDITDCEAVILFRCCSLFSLLQDESQRCLFLALPTLIKSVSISVLSTFLERCCCQPFDQRAADHSLAVAVLRGLTAALRVADPPEAVTALLHMMAGRLYSLMPAHFQVSASARSRTDTALFCEQDVFSDASTVPGECHCWLRVDTAPLHTTAGWLDSRIFRMPAQSLVGGGGGGGSFSWLHSVCFETMAVFKSMRGAHISGPWFDPLWLSFLFSSKIVVYGHCLVTLPTQLMKH